MKADNNKPKKPRPPVHDKAEDSHPLIRENKVVFQNMIRKATEQFKVKKPK